MLHGGVEHVGALLRALGDEVAPAPRLAIDDEALGRGRNGEGRETGDGALARALGPFLRLHVKRAGRQRTVRRDACLWMCHGGLARVVIVLHLPEPLAGGIVDERVEGDRHALRVIEQRVEPVVEERQPVLDARITAAFADGFVEPVVAGRRAELGHVALAEAADALGRELHLADRHEIERAELADRALRFRIERADRFEGVAEEVEPHGPGEAGRVKVDDAAAHRVFARVAHRARAQEAVHLQPGDEGVHVDHVAGRGGEAFRRDARARRHALQDGIDGGREKARPLGGGARARQPRQRRHALRGHRRVRRDAVVGLAIPGREGQHLDLRRDEAQRVLQHLLALPVARHMDESRRPLRKGAERPRQVGDDERVEPVRNAGQGQAAAPFQGIDGAGEWNRHECSSR